MSEDRMLKKGRKEEMIKKEKDVNGYFTGRIENVKLTGVTDHKPEIGKRIYFTVSSNRPTVINFNERN